MGQCTPVVVIPFSFGILSPLAVPLFPTGLQHLVVGEEGLKYFTRFIFIYVYEDLPACYVCLCMSGANGDQKSMCHVPWNWSYGWL